MGANMRTSAAGRINPYKGVYAGSVIYRRKRIHRTKSAIFLSVKLILILLLFYAIGIGGYEGYKYVVSLPYFNISEVIIDGNVNLKVNDIISMSGVRIGQNIFSVDTDDIYRQFGNNPRIKNAIVKKELPDKIRIKINERIPITTLESKGFYLIDGEGVILTELDEGLETGLPVIVDPEPFKYKAGGVVNSEGVFRCIDIWKRVNEIKSVLENLTIKNEITKIEPVNLHRVKLYLKDTGVYIVLDNENMDKGLENFQAVIRSLNYENTIHYLPLSGEEKGIGKELEYIDLSYKGKVIVKYKEGIRGQESEIRKS